MASTKQSQGQNYGTQPPMPDTTLPPDKEKSVLFIQREQIISKYSHDALEIKRLRDQSSVLYDRIHGLEDLIVSNTNISNAKNIGMVWPVITNDLVQAINTLSKHATGGGDGFRHGTNITDPMQQSPLPMAILGIDILEGGDIQHAKEQGKPNAQDEVPECKTLLAKLVFLLIMVLNERKKTLAKNVSDILDDCMVLHAHLRLSKNRGQEVRHQDLVLKREIALIEEEIRLRQETLAEWTADLESINKQLPESYQTMQRDKTSVASPRDQNGSGSPGEGSGDDIKRTDVLASPTPSDGPATSANSAEQDEKEECLREELISKIDMQKQLAFKLRDIFRDTDASLKAFLQEIKKPVTASQISPASMSALTGNTVGIGAANLDRSDIMNSSIYKMARCQLGIAVVSVDLLSSEEEFIKAVENRSKELVAPFTDVRSQQLTEFLALIQKLVSEASKIAHGAKNAKDKIETQLSQKKAKASNEQASSQPGAGPASPPQAFGDEDLVSKLESVRSSHQRTMDILNEISNTKQNLEKCRSSLIEKILSVSDSEHAGLAKELQDCWSGNDDYWGELNGVVQMLLDLEKNENPIWTQLLEKKDMLKQALVERLKQRHRMISLREQNKTCSAGTKAEEDKIQALTLLSTSVRNMGNEASESARLAENLRSRYAEILDNALKREKDLEGVVKAKIAELIQERGQYAPHGNSVIKLDDASFDPGNPKIIPDASDIEHQIMNDKNNEVVDIYQQYAKKQLELAQLEQETFQRNKELELLTVMNKRKADKISDPNSVRNQIYQDMKKQRFCPIMPDKERDCLLSRCGHLFSQDGIASLKVKKCPLCGERFTNDEIRQVFF